MNGLQHMLKLVGIADDVDGDDAVSLDLKRRGLQNFPVLDGYKTRQTINEAMALKPRPCLCVDRGELREQAKDVLDPDRGLFPSWSLAAPVSV